MGEEGHPGDVDAVSAKRGARLLGPYWHPSGWRIIEVDAAGKRSALCLSSKERAVAHIAERVGSGIRYDGPPADRACAKCSRRLQRGALRFCSRRCAGEAVFDVNGVEMTAAEIAQMLGLSVEPATRLIEIVTGGLPGTGSE